MDTAEDYKKKLQKQAEEMAWRHPYVGKDFPFAVDYNSVARYSADIDPSLSISSTKRIILVGGKKESGFYEIVTKAGSNLAHNDGENVIEIKSWCKDLRYAKTNADLSKIGRKSSNDSLSFITKDNRFIIYINHVSKSRSKGYCGYNVYDIKKDKWLYKRGQGFTHDGGLDTCRAVLLSDKWLVISDEWNICIHLVDINVDNDDEPSVKIKLAKVYKIQYQDFWKYSFHGLVCIDYPGCNKNSDDDDNGNSDENNADANNEKKEKENEKEKKTGGISEKNSKNSKKDKYTLMVFGGRVPDHFMGRPFLKSFVRLDLVLDNSVDIKSISDDNDSDSDDDDNTKKTFVSVTERPVPDKEIDFVNRDKNEEFYQLRLERFGFECRFNNKNEANIVIFGGNDGSGMGTYYNTLFVFNCTTFKFAQYDFALPAKCHSYIATTMLTNNQCLAITYDKEYFVFDLCATMLWKIERLIWIAYLKEEKNDKCYFNKLPKDLVKKILNSYLKQSFVM